MSLLLVAAVYTFDATCLPAQFISVSSVSIVTMLLDGRVSIPRHWGKVSVDTGVGNPEKSSADKGERFAKAIIEKLGQFFIELITKEIY
jgi:creatinine amidohydrolase/Fe(II)-dependent formamide hydrolase-like protein